MTRDEERAIIEIGRAVWAEASIDVADRIHGNEHILEGRLIRQVDRSPIAYFHPESDYRDVAFYTLEHHLVEALFQSRERLIAYYNRMTPPAPAEQQDERKDYSPAQNCGKWCGNRKFQRFMHEVHDLDQPKDCNRTATKMHSLLGVSSRAQLDTNEHAARAWHDLRAAFKSWRETRL